MRRSGKVLDIDVVISSIFGAFASHTRLLDAVGRSHFGRDESGVPAHQAGLQGLRNTDSRDVAGKETSGKTKLGIIRHLDDLFLRVEG